MEQGTSRVSLRAENQCKEASRISQSYYFLTITHVTLKHTGHAHARTHKHTHARTHTLQKHVRIFHFCLHHDHMYITEWL